MEDNAYIQTNQCLLKGCVPWRETVAPASCLLLYYLLKNPVGKIRSTQYFWIMSKTHIELQKKNMLVIIMHKNPCGEKLMMKHIA
jgi:hypothetical protein